MQNSFCTHAPYPVPFPFPPCSESVFVHHIAAAACGLLATWHTAPLALPRLMAIANIRVAARLACFPSWQTCWCSALAPTPHQSPFGDRSPLLLLPHLTGARRKKLGTKKREQRTVLHTFLVLSRFLCVKKIFPYDKETKQKDRKTNKQISTKVKCKRKLKIK